MTSNLNWEEIQEALFTGQNTVHRSDIVTRVFNMKLKIMKDVVVMLGNRFGGVMCIQLREFPHVHIVYTGRKIESCCMKSTIGLFYQKFPVHSFMV